MKKLIWYSVFFLIALIFGLFQACGSGKESVSNDRRPDPTPATDDDDDDDSTPLKNPCPEGMGLVMGGTTSVAFQGERWEGQEVQTETIENFCIDVYEASQPDATTDSMGTWKKSNPVPAAESKEGVLPWVEISFDEARAACEAAGKRLPTLAEWQTAYSGLENRDWPWGDQWIENQCYVDKDQLLFPTGGCCYKPSAKEPVSICDMVGNVSEWVDGLWDDKCYGDQEVMVAGGAAHLWHGDSNHQKEDSENPGCWLFVNYSQKRSGLHHHPPYDTFEDDGFRCAMDL